MRKITFIFILVILYSCSGANKIESAFVEKDDETPSHDQTAIAKDSLQPIVDSLVQFNAIYDEAIGFAGSKPLVYTWFEKLNEIAQEDELIRLTHHTSPTVRGYAFWALVERESPKVKEIMLEHTADTVLVARMSGCLRYEEKLNEFFLSIIAPNCVNVDCSRLPANDIKEIKAKMK